MWYYLCFNSFIIYSNSKKNITNLPKTKKLTLNFSSVISDKILYYVLFLNFILDLTVKRMKLIFFKSSKLNIS